MKPRVKEFEVPLTDRVYLLVRIECLRGRIVGFVVHDLRHNYERYDQIYEEN